MPCQHQQHNPHLLETKRQRVQSQSTSSRLPGTWLSISIPKQLYSVWPVVLGQFHLQLEYLRTRSSFPRNPGATTARSALEGSPCPCHTQTRIGFYKPSYSNYGWAIAEVHFLLKTACKWKRYLLPAKVWYCIYIFLHFHRLGTSFVQTDLCFPPFLTLCGRKIPEAAAARFLAQLIRKMKWVAERGTMTLRSIRQIKNRWLILKAANVRVYPSCHLLLIHYEEMFHHVTTA